MCAAYRTVSTEAVGVIADIAPIDLQMEERAATYKKDKKEKARNATLENWQERWDTLTDVAQWTKRLIPDVAT